MFEMTNCIYCQDLLWAVATFKRTAKASLVKGSDGLAVGFQSTVKIHMLTVMEVRHGI